MTRVASKEAPSVAAKRQKKRSKKCAEKKGSPSSGKPRSPGQESPNRITAKTRLAQSVSLSPEDFELVTLVSEEKAIRLDQLAELTGRPIAGVRRDVGRLVQCGFLQADRILAKEKGALWLTPTPEALRRTKFSHSSYRTLPRLKDLNPTFLRVATRIYYASKLQGWKWKSVRIAAAQTKEHLPDGVLQRGARTIAVEIELSDRCMSILKRMSQLSAGFTQVRYHCDKVSRSVVEEAVAMGGFKNVTVHDLPVDHLWFPEHRGLSGERSRSKRP